MTVPVEPEPAPPTPSDPIPDPPDRPEPHQPEPESPYPDPIPDPSNPNAAQLALVVGCQPSRISTVMVVV